MQERTVIASPLHQKEMDEMVFILLKVPGERNDLALKIVQKEEISKLGNMFCEEETPNHSGEA